MARRVKELSSYDGTKWTNPVPIGTNGEYVDVEVVTTSGTDRKPLSQILGTINDTDNPIATQLSSLDTRVDSKASASDVTALQTDVSALETFIDAFTKNMVEGQDNMIDFGSN